MSFTRRQTLGLGATALAGAAVTTIMPYTAMAQDDNMMGDAYPTDSGEITIYPVSHASFVMTVPGMVIYNDPVGGAAAYEGMPAPDVILITHEHGDHYDVPTLEALVGGNTQLLTNPAVYDMLPDALKSKATSIGNGESTTIGDIALDAIPAYNTTQDRLQYHPEGRDNGYVLSIDGKTVYIAGDTEDIPEMRALTGIDIAFLPMNLPYTMDENQAASAVSEFRPAYVYPYHYRGSDLDLFEEQVGDAAEVVRGPWYE